MDERFDAISEVARYSPLLLRRHSIAIHPCHILLDNGFQLLLHLRLRWNVCA